MERATAWDDDSKRQDDETNERLVVGVNSKKRARRQSARVELGCDHEREGKRGWMKVTCVWTGEREMEDGRGVRAQERTGRGWRSFLLGRDQKRVLRCGL